MDVLCHISIVVIIFRIASSASGETVPTYKRTLPSGKVLICDRCKPGFYLQKHCTETEQTVCRKCEEGFYTQVYNYIPQCLACDYCLPEQTLKRRCSSSQNTVCECKEGTYWSVHYCKKHSQCPHGYGIQEKGTPYKDTVCVRCPEGSYAAGKPENKTCVSFTTCKSGEKLLFHGNSETDNVCFTCDDIKVKGEEGLIRSVLLELFINHKSQRLTRFFKRVTRNVTRRRSGSHNCKSKHFTDLIYLYLNDTTLKQLPEMLKSNKLCNLAERVQHKISRVKEEVKLCNNTDFF